MAKKKRAGGVQGRGARSRADIVRDATGRVTVGANLGTGRVTTSRTTGGARTKAHG